MSLYTKSEGSWYEATGSYLKVNGTWIPVVQSGGTSDEIPPTLTVVNPASSSSSTPTYHLDSSTYRVTGTVMDNGSGVAAVYVNGVLATVSGNNWYCDLSLIANTSTKVTVYAIDKKDNQSDSIVRYVVYDSASPSLAISAPTGTSSNAPTYTTSNTYTIAGSVSDVSGIKSLTINGNEISIGSDGSWNCSIALTAETTTAITVVATDNANRSTTATRYVRYDSSAPALTITAPTGTSSSSPTYTNQNATFTYTVTGTVSDSSGIRSILVNNQSATLSGSNWSCNLSLATNTTHTITVVATDNAGRTTTLTRYLRAYATVTYASASALTSGTTLSLNAYTQQEDDSYISCSGASITTLAGIDADEARWVKGYSSFNRTFVGCGQKVTVNTSYTTANDTHPGASEKQAILYLRNTATGGRTQLGNILGVSTSFTVPKDHNTYALDVYTQCYSYGLDPQVSFKLTFATLEVK